MHKSPFALVSFLLIFLFSTGCSEFQKIQKSNDQDMKYQAALKYYQSKDYNKAGLLFEELIPLIRGTKESELAQFYYAYTQYHQGMYEMSKHYFQQFYQTFSRSEFAEEAMYMYAYSLYRNSPAYNLDQTNTYEALDAMQMYINAFPNTERAIKASELIAEMRGKLERKAFENALLYSKTDNYKAAIIALVNFQREFPDSEYDERAAYLKVVNAYQLAKSSTADKEIERYQDTIEYYENFIDRYSGSKLVREAGDLYEYSIKKVGESAAAGTAGLSSTKKDQAKRTGNGAAATTSSNDSKE
jgi:outer membrane protein assembly factor BamD